MNNYDWLISRLDGFIRKYYANQLLRGALVLLICLLLYILTVSVGEYYLYMPVWLRVFIVSAFILLGGAALVVWVIIPFAKMSRLGKVISHEQAAAIVGTHFPEISDKLLNILQLKKQTEGQGSMELIEASINQKAAQISVVPIANAVDLSKNKRYLPFLLPLVLAGVFILVAAPNVFKDASERLLQPTKTFEKPAPFKFIVKNTSMQAVRNGDFVLEVSTEGNALPAEMAVETGADRMPMQSKAKNSFEYTFRNITEPVSFRLFAAGFYSQLYTIQVAQRPVLKAFKVSLDYPDYIGRKDEVLSSMGDMTVPAGTHVSWGFVADYTDEASIRLGDGNAMALPKQVNVFAAQYRFLRDTSYTLILRNKQSNVRDSFHYFVKVIPDQYPTIQLEEIRDTVSGKQILLTGTAGDDYGISKVLFHYAVADGNNKTIVDKSIPLKTSTGTLASFQHYFDAGVLNLQPGQKLTYYVEAWDNDGVQGSKASRSEVMSYQMYNAKQLDSAINENAEQISSGLSNSAEQTKELQSQYRDLQSKMLQSESMSWEQQQSLQEVSKQQMELQNKMEAIKKRFEEQMQQSKQKQYSDEVKDKQEDLQKQMDNLLNNELKEQMKKLEELMKKLNKDQAFQTMKQLEQDNKLFNMDLERMQELMKQLEMQMKLEDLANKMSELAKKEQDLKQQTDKGNKDNKELARKQDDLKKELDKAMNEDMKNLDELNKKMDQQQQEMSKPKEAGKKAADKMQDSKEELSKNEGSKASQSQSQAAQNLQEMSESLSNMAGGMNVQQIDIDIKATRQVLTNLMRLSFDQEQLIKNVQNTPIGSQSYVGNQQEQARLYGNSRMIRDSLFALSKRVSKLAPTINKETSELEKNMAAATEAMQNRYVGNVMSKQQYVMMHTNNLALLLNETLSNLMQMKANAQSGKKGSCNKPGGKTPKPGPGKQLSDIITQQKQLGDAMQQMQDAQNKNGQQPGQQPGNKQGGQQGQQQGESGKQGEYGDPEKLARLAAQQAALRRQLQELNSLLNSKGMGNAREMKEIQDKMDRTETDLVNKRLSSELMLRQKEILTRLLQAEKSLREQEQDDKRSSRSADDISRPMPAELQKFMQEHKDLIQQYKTVPPQLKPYYRSMVEQYYQAIGNSNNK